MSEPRSGTAAGVPFVALPPRTGRPDAPVVISWHLLDPPRTEVAMAAALPLADLDAWRIHLGLPMTGARMPAGGPEELWGMAAQDAVRLVFGPISRQAADEFEPAFRSLQEQLGFGDGPLGLLGGSLGAAVAQLVLTGTERPVRAAVLVSPVVQLRRLVDALAAGFGAPYPWSAGADGIADELDFVARADAVSATGAAVAVVTGEHDDPETLEPAAALVAALTARGSTVDSLQVAGMGHALADEPGVAAAPQTASAATVDRYAVDWFRRHLEG